MQRDYGVLINSNPLQYAGDKSVKNTKNGAKSICKSMKTNIQLKGGTLKEIDVGIQPRLKTKIDLDESQGMKLKNFDYVMHNIGERPKSIQN